MGQIVIDQDEVWLGPRVPNPVLAPGPFQPVIDFSDYDNDLLDANPYQERLTVADVPRIMDIAPAKVSEDTAPTAGGT